MASLISLYNLPTPQLFSCRNTCVYRNFVCGNNNSSNNNKQDSQQLHVCEAINCLKPTANDCCLSDYYFFTLYNTLTELSAKLKDQLCSF